MSLRRAKSIDEYVESVKNAVFEVHDLRDCLEFEAEDTARFPAFMNSLEEGVKTIYRSMVDGSYTFGREDLPFMDLAAKHADEIPLHTLLKQITETHRRGLHVDGDN